MKQKNAKDSTKFANYIIIFDVKEIWKINFTFFALKFDEIDKMNQFEIY